MNENAASPIAAGWSSDTESLCQILLFASNVMDDEIGGHVKDSQKSMRWKDIFERWFKLSSFPHLRFARVKDETVYSDTIVGGAFTNLPSPSISVWLQHLPALETLVLDRDQPHLLAADCEAILRWALLLPSSSRSREAATMQTEHSHEAEACGHYPVLTSVVLSRPRMLESLLSMQESVSFHLGHYVALQIEEMQVQITSRLFIRNLCALSQWTFHQRDLKRRLLGLGMHEVATQSLSRKSRNYALFLDNPTLKIDFQGLETLSELDISGCTQEYCTAAQIPRRLISQGHWPSSSRLKFPNYVTSWFEKLPDKDIYWTLNIPDIKHLHLIEFDPLSDQHRHFLKHLRFQERISVHTSLLTSYKQVNGGLDLFHREAAVFSRYNNLQATSSSSPLETLWVSFKLPRLSSNNFLSPFSFIGIGHLSKDMISKCPLTEAIEKFKCTIGQNTYFQNCEIFVNPIDEHCLNTKDWKWWSNMIQS